MITGLYDIVSLYISLAGEFPGWFILFYLVLHFITIVVCLKRDNNNYYSLNKMNRNTVNTLFWILVIFLFPFGGILLYILFSAIPYKMWKKSRNGFTGSFPGAVKLSYGNCTQQWHHIWTGIQFSAKEIGNHYQYNSRIDIKAVNSTLVLMLMYASCAVIALINDPYAHHDGIYDTTAFQTALVMTAVIIVHDWYKNYKKAAFYFRLVNKNDSFPACEPTDDVMGKPCYKEYDHLRKDGEESREGSVNAKELREKIWEVMPEICSRYALFVLAAKGVRLRRDDDPDRLFVFDNDSGCYIESLNPSFDLDTLDVTDICKVKEVDPHVFCITYYDWETEGDIEDEPDDALVGCVERKIYKVKPRLRYVIFRAALHFAFINLLFSPFVCIMSMTFTNGLASLLSDIF